MQRRIAWRYKTLLARRRENQVGFLSKGVCERLYRWKPGFGDILLGIMIGRGLGALKDSSCV